tara:strand:+ start:982 stop:1410 length:429 start_codon:yes stop_codon:yes gene_type:complete
MATQISDPIGKVFDQKIGLAQKLRQERADLIQQLEENAVAIDELFGQARSTNRQRDDGRIVSELSLGMRLAKILIHNNNQSMTSMELTEAAIQDGWQTSSENPRSVVGQALNQDPDFIKRGKLRARKWMLCQEAYQQLNKEI